MFRMRTGAKLVHIPYKGTGPAVADVVAGHLPAIFAGTAAIVQVRAGKTRMLAVTSEKRLAEIPDVPTFAELGLRDLTTTTWFGLSGPAGMSRDIVTRLNNEVRSALNDPDSVAKLDPLGIVNVGSTPERFAAYLREEIDFVGGIVNRLGIKPEQ